MKLLAVILIVLSAGAMAMGGHEGKGKDGGSTGGGSNFGHCRAPMSECVK